LSGPEISDGGASEPVEVFFSYSRKDRGLRDKLAEHLRILERRGIIRG